MGKFKKTAITNAGKVILFAGGDVTYTKAVLYSQDLSSMSDDDIKALTSIDGQLIDTRLVVNNKADSNIVIEAVFSNEGLKDDIAFSSVGWFAKADDGAETLIAVSPINGTKILGAGAPGASSQSIDLKLNMAISDSAEIHVSIDPSGSVSVADLNKAINDLKPSISNAGNQAKHAQETADSALNQGQNNAKDIADKANFSDFYNLKDTVALELQMLQNALDDKVDRSVAVAEFQTAYGLIDSKANAANTYTKHEVDSKLVSLGGVKTVNGASPDSKGNVSINIPKTDSYTKTETDSKIKTISDAVATKVDKATVDAEISKIDLSSYAKTVDIDTKLKNKADQSNVNSQVQDARNVSKQATDSLQNQVNTLKTQLSDAVNTINYLKQNMVIGRHFSSDSDAQSWYNANPNGIAFIDK